MRTTFFPTGCDAFHRIKEARREAQRVVEHLKRQPQTRQKLGFVTAASSCCLQAVAKRAI